MTDRAARPGFGSSLRRTPRRLRSRLAAGSGALSELVRLVAVLALAVGCTRSSGPLDGGRVDDSNSDLGGDAAVEFDASGLACYPIQASYFDGSAAFELRVGRRQYCDEFGFVVAAAEKAAAEAIVDEPCALAGADEFWCPLSRPLDWTVAPSDYDAICPVEDELGPRVWYCLLYE